MSDSLKILHQVDTCITKTEPRYTSEDLQVLVFSLTTNCDQSKKFKVKLISLVLFHCEPALKINELYCIV